jgi:ATP-dependent exoDNAse (exonuclease V) beta subunit
MYVAMTRARNHLSITYPLNAYSSRRSADYSIDQLSRFIDRGVQKKMSRVVVGAEKKPESAEIEPGKPTIDLRALLRGRFG